MGNNIDKSDIKKYAQVFSSEKGEWAQGNTIIGLFHRVIKKNRSISSSREARVRSYTTIQEAEKQAAESQFALASDVNFQLKHEGESPILIITVNRGKVEPTLLAPGLNLSRVFDEKSATNIYAWTNPPAEVEFTMDQLVKIVEKNMGMPIGEKCFFPHNSPDFFIEDLPQNKLQFIRWKNEEFSPQKGKKGRTQDGISLHNNITRQELEGALSFRTEDGKWLDNHDFLVENLRKMALLTGQV